jgi:hypothetical protein
VGRPTARTIIDAAAPVYESGIAWRSAARSVDHRAGAGRSWHCHLGSARIAATANSGVAPQIPEVLVRTGE